MKALSPFPLRVFDSDNGSEFISHQVADWLQARDTALTRSRPHRKNYQASTHRIQEQTTLSANTHSAGAATLPRNSFC